MTREPRTVAARRHDWTESSFDPEVVRDLGGEEELLGDGAGRRCASFADDCFTFGGPRPRSGLC
jgi:hypothetical protein